MKYFPLIIMTSSLFVSSNKNEMKSQEYNTFTMPESNKWLINAQKGSTINLEIPGNPTTGYGWFLSNANNLNTDVIQPLNLDEYNSADYVSDPAPPGVVGTGGTYTFKFKLKQKTPQNSPVILTFINKRPWEEKIIRKVETSVIIS